MYDGSRQTKPACLLVLKFLHHAAGVLPTPHYFPPLSRRSRSETTAPYNPTAKSRSKRTSSDVRLISAYAVSVVTDIASS
jgi:hypothetical protein